MENIIEIEELKISYSKKRIAVMERVNLQFDSAKVYALLGENGIGKSTLLKAIAGILPFQNGSIKIEGKSLEQWSRSELAKTVAVVLTDSINHSMLSVFDFVAYGRYPFTNWLGKLRNEDIQVIEESIAQCNAEELKYKRLSNLSDGERQKVMIARALAQQTPIIILDEPTTHLDIRNTRAIFKLLKNLAVEQNKTILFSTHQLDSAISIADALVIHTKDQVLMSTPEEYNQNKDLQFILTGE